MNSLTILSQVEHEYLKQNFRKNIKFKTRYSFKSRLAVPAKKKVKNVMPLSVPVQFLQITVCTSIGTIKASQWAAAHFVLEFDQCCPRVTPHMSNLACSVCRLLLWDINQITQPGRQR